jgi:glycosyltransferase involved in cell wall biosynthesis
MKLAIVVNSFPTLSETFIFNKVLGLIQTGVDISVIASSRCNNAGAFADRLSSIRSDQIQFSLLSKGLLGIFTGLFRITFTQPIEAMRLLHQAYNQYPDRKRALRAWIQALPLKLGHFDLIHFELSGLAVAHLDALPLLTPAKLVTSCRGTAEQIKPITDPERGDQLHKVFEYMDRVHCVSLDIQHTVEKYGLKPGQAFVNHPAIDLAQFHRDISYPEKTAGPYRLISIGRLHWVKGLEFGLLAIWQLLDRGYAVEYDILGGGPEEERLRFMIHDLGLTEHVHLYGRRTPQEVHQALENADICLLPSLSEGLSNAALEAMAMELPVVSTTAGGMDEAITDGQEGFLVPPYQPNVIAEKVALLLDNPHLRQQMGKSGRLRVEKDFNQQEQIKKFISVYHSMMCKNNSSSYG